MNAVNDELPPLYYAIIGQIDMLMSSQEPLGDAEGALLDKLVDVAMVYEQMILPAWLLPDRQ